MSNPRETEQIRKFENDEVARKRQVYSMSDDDASDN